MSIFFEAIDLPLWLFRESEVGDRGHGCASLAHTCTPWWRLVLLKTPE